MRARCGQRLDGKAQIAGAWLSSVLSRCNGGGLDLVHSRGTWTALLQQRVKASFSSEVWEITLMNFDRHSRASSSRHAVRDTPANAWYGTA